MHSCSSVGLQATISKRDTARDRVCHVGRVVDRQRPVRLANGELLSGRVSVEMQRIEGSARRGGSVEFRHRTLERGSVDAKFLGQSFQSVINDRSTCAIAGFQKVQCLLIEDLERLRPRLLTNGGPSLGVGQPKVILSSSRKRAPFALTMMP